jgi:hypothetical protein
MDTTTCPTCGMISLADHEQHTSECPRHDPATCSTCSASIEPEAADTTTCAECGILSFVAREQHTSRCSRYDPSMKPVPTEPPPPLITPRMRLLMSIDCGSSVRWPPPTTREQKDKAIALLTRVGQLRDSQITSETIRTVLSHLGQFTAAEIEGIVDHFNQLPVAPPSAA